MTTQLIRFATIAAFAALSVATPSFAQEPVSPSNGKFIGPSKNCVASNPASGGTY